MFEEYRNCFQKIKNDPLVKCVIVCGSGPIFSAGIDFKEIFEPAATDEISSNDPARNALKKKDMLLSFQDSLSQAESCDKPVIMAVHGNCIGLGIDIITAGDIRLCTKDTKFSVKEVDLALAADIGTLQRLPKVVSNHSWAREVCYTARVFDGKEALQFGLVSQIFDTQDGLMEAASKLAIEIAKKSPIAVLGTKHLLNYSRDHTVSEGLTYTATWNSVMLQTEDIPTAIEAMMSKSIPKFSKL
ncbi:hypothetical protein DSO57_1014625 [Entomophthora muscae]|nr:hypothetical protein DSO57_1014625 [Entomophthora muscae]